MYAKPIEPEGKDHYGALGLEPDATDSMIKKAYRKLALKYHPDKQAPGQEKDDSKFVEVLIAYETLTKPEEREKWEDAYPNVHEQWKKYRRDLADWERLSAAEAEAEAERARNRTHYEEQERRRNIWLMGEAEKNRRAAKAEEEELHDQYRGDYQYRYTCYCRGCEKRQKREANERRSNMAIPTADEYAEYKQMKQEEAERRQHEAMRKRREEQAREARERMHKEQEKAARIARAEDRKRAAKAKVKAERSNEAARRAREQQEKDAQLRMARRHVHDRRREFLQQLQDGAAKLPPDVEFVVDIAWTKKKGASKCLFCEQDIKFYSFRCPEGGAVACNPCMKGMCRVTVPTEELGSDGEGSKDGGEDDGGDGHVEEEGNVGMDEEERYEGGDNADGEK